MQRGPSLGTTSAVLSAASGADACPSQRLHEALPRLTQVPWTAFFQKYESVGDPVAGLQRLSGSTAVTVAREVQ